MYDCYEKTQQWQDFHTLSVWNPRAVSNARGFPPRSHCKTHPMQSCIVFSITKDTMQGHYWLFGNEVKAHAVEQLVFLQHHRSQRVHLLHVEVELDASRRVSEKVSLVLEARRTSGRGKQAAVHTRSSGNTLVERCATVTHCRQSQHLLLDGFFFVVTHPGRHCHFWGHAEISLITKQSSRRRDDSVYGCLTQRMRGQRNIMKLDLFLLSWSYDPCGTSSFSGKCIIGSSYSVRDCSSHWITF